MKRRFFECALLLGIVMSVMFLAQTPDGIGHSANMHDPQFDVDSSGNEVAQGEGDDPRGRSFWNSDGSVIGYAWGEGWQYEGGLINGATEDQTNDPNNPGHPSDDKDQMIYVLQVRADCYAGGYSCRSEIKPSLSYVRALPPRRNTFGGWGSISLEFSHVCYHEVVRDGLFASPRCEEREREKTAWSGGQSIFIDVTLNEYAEKRSGSFGLSLKGVTASYTHEYQEKYSDLRARGFGIKAKLTGDPFDEVIWKQDKYAGASGYVEGASTGGIGAARPGVDGSHLSRITIKLVVVFRAFTHF